MENHDGFRPLIGSLTHRGRSANSHGSSRQRLGPMQPRGFLDGLKWDREKRRVISSYRAYNHSYLGGGLIYFFLPLPGEMIQFGKYFQLG